MTRQVQSKDKSLMINVTAGIDETHLSIYNSSDRRCLGGIELDKFRLGLLIDHLTATYNEMEGNLKELTLMVPEDAVVTVDGEKVPNE